MFAQLAFADTQHKLISFNSNLEDRLGYALLSTQDPNLLRAQGRV
jgi:hypothetical protein